MKIRGISSLVLFLFALSLSAMHEYPPTSLERSKAELLKYLDNQYATHHVLRLLSDYIDPLFQTISSRDECDSFRNVIEFLRITQEQYASLDEDWKERYLDGITDAFQYAKQKNISYENIRKALIELIEQTTKRKQKKEKGVFITSWGDEFSRLTNTKKRSYIERRFSLIPRQQQLLAACVAAGTVALVSHNHIQECKSKGTSTVFETAWQKAKRGYLRVMRVVRIHVSRVWR